MSLYEIPFVVWEWEESLTVLELEHFGIGGLIIDFFLNKILQLQFIVYLTLKERGSWMLLESRGAESEVTKVTKLDL